MSIVALGLGACGPKPPAPEGAAPSTSHAARLVNATILANGCEALGRGNGVAAEHAMYELVEGCTAVPGGNARFFATLLPGGQIKIAAADGQPDVVPICILKHPLSHKVPLERPCRLDVNITQASVSVALDAGPR